MAVFEKIKSIRLLPRIVVVTLAAMLAVACAGNPQAVDVDNDVSDKLDKPGNSLMGNYLAGLHAQSEDDINAAIIYFGAALELDPENYDLLQRTFLGNLSNGYMVEAIAQAHRIIAVSPNNQFAILTLATDSIARGQFEEARSILDGLDDKGLNSYLKPLLKAWSYVGDSATGVDGEAALSALSPLAENPSTNLLHNAHAALINAAAGNNEQAETLFIDMIETQGGMSLRKTLLFGAYYEGIGEFDKAGALYNGYIAEYGSAQFFKSALDRITTHTVSPEAALNASQGAAEAIFDLTGSLRQQNAMETALLLSRLGLHMAPDFPALLLVTGGILETFSRYDSAQEIYTRIRTSSDFAWDAQLRIASILDELGQPERAIKALRLMVMERPEVIAPLIDIGDILRRLERYDEAVEAYDQAIARLPDITEDYWVLYYSLGIALERTKNWPRAEESLKKALELSPDQPFVLNYLAYSWVEQGINLQQSTEMLRTAREQRPDDAYIIDSVGWVNYQLGAYEDAVNDLEKAVELMPHDPIVNDHLGDAYWQVGRHREARFQWKRALSMDPEPDTIPLIESKIKSGIDAPQAKSASEDDNG